MRASSVAAQLTLKLMRPDFGSAAELPHTVANARASRDYNRDSVLPNLIRAATAPLRVSARGPCRAA